MKKFLLSILMISMLALVFSCGNNGASEKGVESETHPTADEDGNTNETVVVKDIVMKGTINRGWKKETPTKKEEKNIEEVKKFIENNDIENDNYFECLYGDIDSHISVWSLLKGNKDDVFDNYGIVIRKDEKNSVFPDVCHGNDPIVDVDEDKDIVLLAAGVIEGTGTHTEALYIFGANGDAMELKGFVDPYDIISYVNEKMTCDINGNEVAFKVGRKKVTTIQNHEEGYGVLRRVDVGDQIFYDIDDNHNVKVSVTPGLKFGVTTVLFYDDMPTFEFDVKINNGKVSFGDIKLAKE